MKNLIAGVYYIRSADRVVLLTKCRNHESSFNTRTEKPEGKICICNWEQESGHYSDVLLTAKQFKEFTRIGDL